jgi:hypothetical protein
VNNEEVIKKFEEAADNVRLALNEAPAETKLEPGKPDADGVRMRDLRKDEIGPLMVFWSAGANRKRLQDIRAKLKKAFAKERHTHWKGAYEELAKIAQTRRVTPEEVKEISEKHTIKEKWDGLLLHLLPNETIGGMKLPQVEALYEAIMKLWDPEFHRIRMAQKTAAQAEHAALEKAKHAQTAEAIADHLETIAKAAELRKGAELLETTVRLDAAARAKTL